MLRCAAHMVCPSGLCWAAWVSWLQHKLSWVMVTEKPAGSSHLGLSITPLAWPCRYLKVEQQALVNVRLFDGRNEGYNIFRHRKFYERS